MKFGTRLRLLLKYTRLSQKEFAIRNDFSESRLSNIINNKCKPTIVEINKILNAFNIPYDCLMGNVVIFDGLLEDYNDSHIFEYLKNKDMKYED